jgi:hypothetical protein
VGDYDLFVDLQQKAFNAVRGNAREQVRLGGEQAIQGAGSSMRRRRGPHQVQGAAKVEHSIGAIKRVFGFTKVRYRGLDKNADRLLVIAALAICSSGGVCPPRRWQAPPVGYQGLKKTLSHVSSTRCRYQSYSIQPGYRLNQAFLRWWQAGVKRCV